MSVKMVIPVRMRTIVKVKKRLTQCMHTVVLPMFKPPVMKVVAMPERWMFAKM